MQRIIVIGGLLLGALAGACVDIPDPHHCWNLERDRTCVEQWGKGSVCSQCLRGYSGCVAAAEAPDCYVDDDEDESSSSGGEGSSS